MITTQIIIAGGILLIFLLTIILIQVYLQKKKILTLLTLKDSEIQKQKELVEQKNKEITEGVIYARRIQSAILPNPQKIAQILPDSFIYFKPRDIVSGDFYWIERRSKKTMFAAVDCTGHGVPGALMSIIGYDGLNRAISEFEITKSDKIVNALNDEVTETLKQTGSVDIKDGMDISLCVLNRENNVMEYTGAKNPVYIVRKSDSLEVDNNEVKPNISDGNYSLFEVKADRMSIEPTREIKKFTPHRMQLEKNDRVYVFTDGYPDQFGGEQGKKLSYQSFRKILLSIQNLSMEDQKNQLEIELEKWQGDHDQLDDILILGVNI